MISTRVEDQRAQHINSGRKRKAASDTESIAIDLSRISFKLQPHSTLQVAAKYVRFQETSRHFQRGECTWRDSKTKPCYCENSSLKFVACLPDRNYLTRFSVRCQSCYDADTSAVHLYCAYCDEVLTGSIAEPGGKVSDHLITTRHVYQQALAMRDSLEREDSDSKAISQGRDYLAKLEGWAGKIRFAARGNPRKAHLDDLMGRLRLKLGRSCTTWPVCVADILFPYLFEFKGLGSSE